MTVLLVALLSLLGGIYVTPGALPVAASTLVFVSRVAVGFGFIVSAVAVGVGLPALLEIALGIFGLAHAIAAWAIFRQPCKSE